MGKLWIASAAVVVAGMAFAAPADAQRVWQNNRWVSMPPQSRPNMGNPNVGRPDFNRPGAGFNRPNPGSPGWNRPNPGKPGWNQPNPGNPGWNHPNPGNPGWNHGNPGRPNMGHGNGHRWNMVNGRWDGGWRAPGGWNSYHRLGRGGHLPNYWRGADFRIYDYLSYGLSAPPSGYYWSRYYDDAVLVDGRGEVWDSIDGVSWLDAEASSDDGYSEAYAVAGGDYAAPRIEPVAPDGYYNAQAPGYGAPIPYPAPGGYIPQPRPPVVQTYAVPAPGCVQACAANGAYYNGTFYGGGVTTTTSSAGYGGTTTTVVITPAPITTTTITEEVVQERVVKTSYVRPRPVVRKVRYRKPSCCQCLCR